MVLMLVVFFLILPILFMFSIDCRVARIARELKETNERLIQIIEEIREIFHFRLCGRALDDGGAFRQHGGDAVEGGEVPREPAAGVAGAAGMAAALPHLDLFAPAATLDDLAALETELATL